MSTLRVYKQSRSSQQSLKISILTYLIKNVKHSYVQYTTDISNNITQQQFNIHILLSHVDCSTALIESFTEFIVLNDFKVRGRQSISLIVSKSAYKTKNYLVWQISSLIQEYIRTLKTGCTVRTPWIYNYLEPWLYMTELHSHTVHLNHY